MDINTYIRRLLNSIFLVILLIAVGCSSPNQTFLDFQKESQIPELILPLNQEHNFDLLNIIIVEEPKVDSVKKLFEFNEKAIIVFDEDVNYSIFSEYSNLEKVVLIRTCASIQEQVDLKSFDIGLDYLSDSEINFRRFNYLNFLNCSEELIPHISCLVGYRLGHEEDQISVEDMIVDCFRFSFRHDYDNQLLIENDFAKAVDVVFVIKDDNSKERFSVYAEMIKQFYSSYLQ